MYVIRLSLIEKDIVLPKSTCHSPNQLLDNKIINMASFASSNILHQAFITLHYIEVNGEYLLKNILQSDIGTEK